jgi:hypothetical protein
MTKKGFLFSACGILLALLALGAYIGVYTGNVRAVVDGHVYRSAQLTGPSLRATMASWLGHRLEDEILIHHIHTVVNLRGYAPASPWYQSEVAVCRRVGVKHLDIELTDHDLPPPERLKALFDIFEEDAYPILIHCQAGADRSGLVSALYLIQYQHVPLKRAVHSQLSWQYGHLPFGPAQAMERFFNLYSETNDGLGLREWALSRYPALYRKNSSHR